MNKIKDLKVMRVSDSDDVIVSGEIANQHYEVHVWHSHLYGKNESSLHGDKKKIRAYVEQELIAAFNKNNSQDIEL